MSADKKPARAAVTDGLRWTYLPLLAFWVFAGCVPVPLTEQGKALRTPADPIVVRDFTWTQRANGAAEVVQLLTAKVVEELRQEKLLAGAIILSDPQSPGEAGIELQGMFIDYERHNAAAYITASLLIAMLTFGCVEDGMGPSKTMAAEISIVDARTQEKLATVRVGTASDFGTPETMTAAFAKRVRGVVVGYQKAVAAQAK